MDEPGMSLVLYMLVVVYQQIVIQMVAATQRLNDIWRWNLQDNQPDDLLVEFGSETLYCGLLVTGLRVHKVLASR